MRVAPKITLNQDDRQLLRRWAKGRSTPARLVLRARIVLSAAEGKENKVIAKELGTNRPLVGKWRARFAQGGIAVLVFADNTYRVAVCALGAPPGQNSVMNCVVSSGLLQLTSNVPPVPGPWPLKAAVGAACQLLWLSMNMKLA